MHASVLEQWIFLHTGCKSRQALDDWQLAQLRTAVARAKTRSRFYGAQLADVDECSLRTVHDLAQLPFTTGEQLRHCPEDWLCCSGTEIERVVTLKTSGTTAPPKRVFFTKEDQEQTIDFFACGMQELVSPGDSVLILMPSTQPGSVGDLLSKGLARMGVTAVPAGPVTDIGVCYNLLRRSGCNSLVGIPVQVLGLAEYGALLPPGQRVRLKSILLSADTTPPPLVARLQGLLDCPVFTHFGMTEMGIGMAVECGAHQGCHIRENNLLVEVVNPETGVPVPDGAIGEFVFTTLNRHAMPFLRYRSGDLGSILATPCPCGSFIRRMLPQGGRIVNRGPLPTGATLSLWQLDEILFSCPHLVNYTLQIVGEKLKFSLYGVIPPRQEVVRQQLMAQFGFESSTLSIQSHSLQGFVGTGMQKRSLQT